MTAPPIDTPRMDYRGEGCGGCNIPVTSLEHARDYASAHYATSFVIRIGERAMCRGTRRDCRFCWTVTHESAAS